MAEVQKYSILVLVTNSFPFGALTEANFVIPELQALSASFERVIIMPTTLDDGKPLMCPLPDNIKVDTSWCSHPDWTQKWRRIRFLLKPGVMKENKRWTDLSYAASAHAFAAVMRRWIKANSIDISKTLFYTFWFDFPTAALSMLAREIGLKYFSRAHRRDIYENRAMTLRHTAIANSLGIFCVGQAGADFLKTQFPDLVQKIDVIHLGSQKSNLDMLSSAHSHSENKLTFLSVARVAKEKRVHLNYRMLRALAIGRPDCSIRWIHIGDGPLMSDLQRLVSDECPKNLIVDLKGAMPNHYVQQLYTSEPIDWTILLSEDEGLPITVCESLSYGVPVIATMVRGTDEIVDDDCGLPLPPDPEPEEFVRGILPYLDSPIRFERLRKGAFAHWQENFDASILRPQFAQFIQSL